MNRYQTALAYANRIETELRQLGVWQDEPLPPAAYQGQRAFMGDTMTFYQWLQFVLLDRVREIVRTRDSFPAQSQVGTYAVRELDGVDEAGDLIQALCEFDDFIEGRSNVLVMPAPRNETAELDRDEPEIKPVELDPPLEVVARYWESRDRNLEHSDPSPGPSYDARLAERVFETVTRFVEVAGEVEEEDGLMRVPTLVEAERGYWVIQTVLGKDCGQWRVDPGASLSRTAWMFLRLKNIHPPYTDKDDARGRAMTFWEQVFNHNDRWQRELMTPESGEPLFLGTGEVDELCWYLGHTEEGDTAVVRVLTNTRDECRFWKTQMVRRNGAWLVDLAATKTAR